jgi:hypothetical protein
MEVKSLIKSSQGHGLSSPWHNGLENPFSFLEITRHETRDNGT